MTLIESELRAALRVEAAAHLPDREAMLDRITQTAMRSHLTHRRPASRVRIAAAAVAVATVLGGGGFAQWALAGDGEPRPEPPVPTVTVPVAPTPSAPAPSSATPTTPASSSATSITTQPPSRSTSKSVAPSASGFSGPPPADQRAKEPVRANGTIAPDGRRQGSSVVTVRTTERLTALEVTIRVTRTPELVSRGGSQQVPGASVTSTVTEEPDALVHRFLLSSGDNVEPGTYTFSARYTFADGGRDANPDTYRAVATTAGGETVTITGGFS
ncbi:hypothetical protein [Actinoplanes sp. GCM10030250]|uniref:hypothetical protein n=1 Tax=Actinoplanes sp. GCM10030250 TaxID=3273376 RepID=UPI00361B40E9